MLRWVVGIAVVLGWVDGAAQAEIWDKETTPADWVELAEDCAADAPALRRDHPLFVSARDDAVHPLIVFTRTVRYIPFTFAPCFSIRGYCDPWHDGGASADAGILSEGPVPWHHCVSLLNPFDEAWKPVKVGVPPPMSISPTSTPGLFGEVVR